MSKSSSKIISYKERIKRFRLMLIAFFSCLVLPLGLIVYYGFQQFEGDMDFQYRWKSINTLKQVNKTLGKRMKIERKRPVSHYSFYQDVINPLTNELSRELSPLADPRNYAENQGLIGYFQINAQQQLGSPLLPNKAYEGNEHVGYDLDLKEIAQRKVTLERIRNVLTNNGFELTSHSEAAQTITPNTDAVNKSVVELFQLKWTENDELIVYRNVWLGQQRTIQGFIVDQNIYLNEMVAELFNQGHYENEVLMQLKGIRDFYGKQALFKYDPNVEGTFRVQKIPEALERLQTQKIYHGSLIAPFQQMKLKFTTDKFPLGSASNYVILILWVLLVVVFLGFVGLYWVGIKHIELAEQRMNFVSSVSHELKTPLTTILMYSDMIRSGIVTDSNSHVEYNQFIYDESHRLTRLINNILQLSKLSQDQEAVRLEATSLGLLNDNIRSKVSSLIDKHGFKLNFAFENGATEKDKVQVDLDAFSQIMINLVDNAIKFFNAAQIEDDARRLIDISFSKSASNKGHIDLTIRDYGPGISSEQQDHIFELFYREGNELTRTAPGTGIGLALVHELVVALEGDIKVKRLDCGVAFTISFNRLA